MFLFAKSGNFYASEVAEPSSTLLAGPRGPLRRAGRQPWRPWYLSVWWGPAPRNTESEEQDCRGAGAKRKPRHAAHPDSPAALGGLELCFSNCFDHNPSEKYTLQFNPEHIYVCNRDENFMKQYVTLYCNIFYYVLVFFIFLNAGLNPLN